MPDLEPRVKVQSGILRGVNVSRDVRRFLGIPYAAPPVGDFRWKPPQPVASWEGDRGADFYGPSSIQKPPPPNSLYYGGEKEFSEDCLYLNVWTGSPSDSDRPVLVFLHFGAHQFGSGSNPIYDGTSLAKKGITVVTVNWRLGRFGFLAHPDLTTESPEGSSGNYGFMDQIAALQWVQNNIHAFGGNAANVTLAGVSAGANSVHALRSSVLAKGLFAKVIAMSGSGVTPQANEVASAAQLNNLSHAEKAGVELMEQLGAKSIAEMRNIPAEDILRIMLPRAQGYWSIGFMPQVQISSSVFDTSYPIIDGYVLTKTPLEALLSGEVHDTPMLASNTGNESSGLPCICNLAKFEEYLNQNFNLKANDKMHPYHARTDAEAREASWKINQDQMFIWPTWTAARLQAKTMKSPVWYSRFLRTPPVPSSYAEYEYAGSYHGADVLYAFGNLDKLNWAWEKCDESLSFNMMQSWINFVFHHKPGNDGKGEWQPLRAGNEFVQIWDIAGSEEDPGLDEERIAFWDSHFQVAS